MKRYAFLFASLLVVATLVMTSSSTRERIENESEDFSMLDKYYEMFSDLPEIHRQLSDVEAIDKALQ